MALIKCLECGKEVSEKALICPNCGSPIRISDLNKEKEQAAKEAQRKILFLILGFLALLIIIFFITT